MTCNLLKHSDRQFCCGKCQRAFSAMKAFDWHRRGADGTCRDPGQQGGFVAREIPGVNGWVTLWGVPAPEVRPEAWRHGA